jgi:Septum formation
VAKSDDPWSIARLDEDFVRGARVQELSAAERAKEAKALQKADRKGTTTIVLNDGTYASGDCVRWDQNSGKKTREVQTVNCEAAHLYEMAGDSVVPEPWASGSFPSRQESNRMIATACGVVAAHYFGGPIDPFGFVEVTAISPSEQGWHNGDRQIHCALTRGVINRSDATAVTKDLEVETNGSMRTSDQRFPWKIGDCLTKETWTLRVPCDEPHMYEFVGWGELPSQSTPPDVDDPSYNERCDALAHTYQPDTPSSIDGWNMTIQPESWAVGTRVFACYLGSVDKDLDDLPAKRVGSVRAVTV